MGGHISKGDTHYWSKLVNLRRTGWASKEVGDLFFGPRGLYYVFGQYSFEIHFRFNSQVCEFIQYTIYHKIYLTFVLYKCFFQNVLK